MNKSQKNKFPELHLFDERLIEFERKTEEDDFDKEELDLEAGYNLLKEDIDYLHRASFEDEETDIIEGFVKRLDLIRDHNGLYNEEAERDTMFQDRTDREDGDGELESGFSTDKYFGLND